MSAPLPVSYGVVLPSSPPPDRYEPLPGLFGLPGFLLRKLSPRGRRVAAAVGLALVASTVAGLLLVVPDARRESRGRMAAQERTARAAAVARRERLTQEARPRSARGPAAAGLKSSGALEARRRLLAAVEVSVLADARSRELPGGPYKSAVCSGYPKGLDPRPPSDDLKLPVTRLECLAVSSVVQADERTTGSLVGQPYRARVDFRTGRYAWCKIVQRPGELAVGREPVVRVSRVCGGS